MKRTPAIVLSLAVLAAVVIAGWLLRDRIGAWVGDETPPPATDDGTHAGHDGADSPSPGASTDEPRVAIDVAPHEQARIGVRVTTVERRAVRNTIRAVGFVTADERLESHVHTRIAGYVEKLEVDAVGDRVARGEVLYRLYSPEVFATEHEYASSAGRGELSAMMARAALERLELWDVPSAEIQRLKKTRKPRRTIAFTSPVDGFVLDKNVLLGMYVTPAMELYHLADLSTVWVIVTLYEHELPIVALGDPVTVTLAGLKDASIEGTVTYVYPEVDVATRTAKARVEVVNEDFALKPGMYAQAKLTKDLGEALLVPNDAVIETGVRELVFVRVGEARFEPREVTLGPRVSDGRVVRRGVSEGEEVVVRASFLIDAESRLQAALARGASTPSHGEHGGS